MQAIDLYLRQTVRMVSWVIHAVSSRCPFATRRLSTLLLLWPS
jgi:hypothetical protein